MRPLWSCQKILLPQLPLRVEALDLRDNVWRSLCVEMIILMASDESVRIFERHSPIGLFLSCESYRLCWRPAGVADM
jgi:hypothetical protein